MKKGKKKKEKYKRKQIKRKKAIKVVPFKNVEGSRPQSRKHSLQP